MKVIIVKIISFIAIFIVLLGILSYILMPKNNDKASGMEDVKANGILGEKENTIDVVVIGDSEAYTAIIPMQLWEQYGFTSYVCATPAQSLSDSYMYIGKALKTQSPKLVILESDNIFRDMMITAPFEKALNRILPITKYHDRWKELKPQDFTSKVEYTYTDELKGYKYTKSIREADSSRYMDGSKKKKDIPTISKLYVEAIKNYCDKNNIKLMIVSTPSVKNWDYEKHNSIVELADELGVDFLDLNEYKDVLNIDWKHDSKDGGDHLNYYGAQKATSYLGEYLYNKNILEDHRNDEKYKEWDKVVDDFNKMVEKD
ncbi:MAG: hypothetical protein IKG42_02690 [Clostridia bacterium]|nr:hypothetical protein [Clostridia bacterium]